MREILILRLIHVVSGVFWAGTMFFFVLFLEPITRDAGPEGGRMMQRIGGSSYPAVMAAVAGLTVLSGLRMYQIVAAGTPGWFHTTTGIVLSAGAAAAIIAFIVGMTVSRPAGKRMGQLAHAVQASGTPPSEAQLKEIASLRARLVGGTRWVAGFLVIAVAAMATARYAG